MFVCLEGIDGSGKRTQAKMLHDALLLLGKECLLTSEPVYESPTGKIIHALLHGKKKPDSTTLQLLFVTDRAAHMSDIILPALDAGINVILDRYIFSTVAFGAALGLDKEWLLELNRKFVMPDYTFIMDIDPEHTAERLLQRSLDGEELDLHEKEIELQKNTRMEYLNLAKESKNCFVINANRDKDEVHKEIVKILGL